MTFEEHFKSLIEDLNNRFPQLVKKYNLCVTHSGGGCFHVDYVLNNKLSVSINPFNEDVEYDVRKDKIKWDIQTIGHKKNLLIINNGILLKKNTITSKKIFQMMTE